MKIIVRLFVAVIMRVCIDILALMVIPSLSLFQGLLESYTWLSRGDITQITLLVVSLLLMCVFSKGNLSTYGFKSVKISQLLKPVLISIIVAFTLIVLSIVIMIIGGAQAEGGESSAMAEGVLKHIISVWIIASICEEFFSRGLLQGFLDPFKKYGFRLFRAYISVPVTISAIAFGLGHLCLLGRINTLFLINILILATVLGFIAGYYREKTGSIIPAIVVHLLFNIVGSIPLLLMKLMQG